MIRIFIMLLLVIGAFNPTIAQENNKGIVFAEGLSWETVLQKAKQENKYIFMDCYTTWCGPCKMLAKNVFPREECP